MDCSTQWACWWVGSPGQDCPLGILVLLIDLMCDCMVSMINVRGGDLIPTKVSAWVVRDEREAYPSCRLLTFVMLHVEIIFLAHATGLSQCLVLS